MTNKKNNQELQIFNNVEFGEIRTMFIDDKVYFVANDVAGNLGYSNVNDALKRHCRGVVKHDLIDSLGRKQTTNFLTEGDVYRLISKSKLPKAEQFESWVFDEVLPEIRKTGSYLNPNLSKLEILKMALESEEKRLQLEKTIEEQKPLIEEHQVFCRSDDTISMKDTADVLSKEFPKLGRTTLFIILRDLKILGSTTQYYNRPKRKYIEAGYFKENLKPIEHKSGKTDIVPVVRVTPAGVRYIRKKLTEFFGNNG